MSVFPSPVPDRAAVPAACQCTRDANNLTASALQHRLQLQLQLLWHLRIIINAARTAIAIFDG